MQKRHSILDGMATIDEFFSESKDYKDLEIVTVRKSFFDDIRGATTVEEDTIQRIVSETVMLKIEGLY